MQQQQQQQQPHQQQQQQPSYIPPNCRMCAYDKHDREGGEPWAPPAGHADNCPLRDQDDRERDFGDLLVQTGCVACMNANRVSANGFPLTPRSHTCGKQGT